MSSEGSSPASERRSNLVDSVAHRLSVDLGVNLLGPDGNPLPVGAPPQPTGQVLDEEQGAIAATPSAVGGQGAIAATPSTVGGIETINNPVSIMYQVYRTNVEGLVSATPALAFILGSKLLVDWLAAKGGPWGDTMGARCALCMSVIELGVMGLNYKQPGYVRKRLLLGVPTQIAFAALLSYAAFDWKPGLWTPLMMTLSFWLSMVAHYPMNPEKKTFLQHVCSTLMIALLLHLGFVGLNFAIVIPTRLLAENDKPVLTLLTTGAAFPFLAFLMRKFMVGLTWKLASSSTLLTPVQRMEYYAKGVKIGSLMILITPTVTLYFNTNIRYAIGSAMLQIVTEIAAKIVTVYMTKKQVFGHVKVAAIGPASKDAGDHQDGQQVGASKGREDDEEQRGDAESKKKHALAMMAVRWHGEIVAEKGCILAAALIAYLYFADLVESDSQGLFLIGCVFYAAEALCDLSFVWVVDKHMEVPMLSAVAYEPLLSKDSMVSSVILALAFVAMSNCIAMAASVEL